MRWRCSFKAATRVQIPFGDAIFYPLESHIYTQNPALVPMASRACDLNNPILVDVFDPPLGLAVVYLVTGDQNGSESDLGSDSSGNLRPNDNPCP